MEKYGDNEKKVRNDARSVLMYLNIFILVFLDTVIISQGSDIFEIKKRDIAICHVKWKF